MFIAVVIAGLLHGASAIIAGLVILVLDNVFRYDGAIMAPLDLIHSPIHGFFCKADRVLYSAQNVRS